MLIASLFVSAILLVLVNQTFRSRRPIALTLATFALFAFLPLFLMCMLPAVALQVVCLLIVLIFCGATGRSSTSFAWLSVAGTLVAYVVVVAGLVWQEQQEYGSLRAEFPYESMETRVPQPRRSSPSNVLSQTIIHQLARVEERVHNEENTFRAFLLERLHESTVTNFVNSPGFGAARMIRPSRAGLEAELQKAPAIPNPGTRFPLIGASDPLDSLPYRGEKAPLQDLHEGSVVDFAYPRGFGLVKDRQHVAGFQPHQFSHAPEPKRWKLEVIDLVSLLLHDPPMAYVSAHLPRMDELREASIRELDAFERSSLAHLRSGEDLFIRGTESEVRMVGSIRAVKQCVTCHGCERGDLLGAFSYVLRGE